MNSRGDCCLSQRDETSSPDSPEFPHCHFTISSNFGSEEDTMPDTNVKEGNK